MWILITSPASLVAVLVFAARADGAMREAVGGLVSGLLVSLAALSFDLISIGWAEWTTGRRRV